jgi:hypothetical protein
MAFNPSNPYNCNHYSSYNQINYNNKNTNTNDNNSDNVKNNKSLDFSKIPEFEINFSIDAMINKGFIPQEYANLSYVFPYMENIEPLCKLPGLIRLQDIPCHSKYKEIHNKVIEIGIHINSLIDKMNAILDSEDIYSIDIQSKVYLKKMEIKKLETFLINCNNFKKLRPAPNEFNSYDLKYHHHKLILEVCDTFYSMYFRECTQLVSWEQTARGSDIQFQNSIDE